MFDNDQIMEHFTTRQKNSIYLKLRFPCGMLNADRYKYYKNSRPKCLQCFANKQEIINHYFVDCTKYEQPRQLFEMNVEILIKDFTMSQINS